LRFRKQERTRRPLRLPGEQTKVRQRLKSRRRRRAHARFKPLVCSAKPRKRRCGEALAVSIATKASKTCTTALSISAASTVIVGMPTLGRRDCRKDQPDTMKQKERRT